MFEHTSKLIILGYDSYVNMNLSTQSCVHMVYIRPIVFLVKSVIQICFLSLFYLILI